MAGDIDDDWEDKARKRIAQFPDWRRWRRFDGLETLRGLACALEEIDALRAELAAMRAVLEEERQAYERHVAALRARVAALDSAAAARAAGESRAEELLGPRKYADPREAAQDPPPPEDPQPLPEEEPAPRSTPEWYAKFDPTVCQRRSDCLGLRPSSGEAVYGVVCWGTGRCQRLERWQP